MTPHLIRAFQKGESWAFGEIYRKFRLPISRYVSARVKDPGTVQELTQDIFFKVFRFATQYRPGFAFTTWLWTIAGNTLKDHRRSRASKSVLVLSIDSDDSTVSEELRLESSADERLERKQQRRILFRATRLLSPLQRRVLWLRLVVQLPYSEIATRLGMSVSSVKSLFQRTRERLGSLLPNTPAAEGV